jgi:hypothetical protein
MPLARAVTDYQSSIEEAKKTRREVDRTGRLGSPRQVFLAALARRSYCASKRNPKDLPKSEHVLFAALRMFHSQAAIARMAETLQVSRVDAESPLTRLPNAKHLRNKERARSLSSDVSESRVDFRRRRSPSVW